MFIHLLQERTSERRKRRSRRIWILKHGLGRLTGKVRNGSFFFFLFFFSFFFLSFFNFFLPSSLDLINACKENKELVWCITRRSYLWSLISLEGQRTNQPVVSSSRCLLQRKCSSHVFAWKIPGQPCTDTPWTLCEAWSIGWAGSWNICLDSFPLWRSSSNQASSSCLYNPQAFCTLILLHCCQVAHGAADAAVPSCRLFNETDHSLQGFRGCLPLPREESPCGHHWTHPQRAFALSQVGANNASWAEKPPLFILTFFVFLFHSQRKL